MYLGVNTDIIVTDSHEARAHKSKRKRNQNAQCQACDVPLVEPYVVSGDGTGEAGPEHTTEQAHTHIHTQFYWHLSHITYTLRESLRKSPLLLPTTSIYIPP